MAKTTKDAKKAAKEMSDSNGAAGTTWLKLLVDRTGSMSGLQEAVVTGVNEFVHEFRDKKKTRIGIDQFDAHPGEPVIQTMVQDCKPKDVPEFTIKDYRPRGSTPLNDAIAETIQTLDKKIKPGDKVLLVIITDGLENASELNTEDLKKLIKKYEKREEWTFLYLGANQQSEVTAAGIGLAKKGQAMNFAATPAGTRSTFKTTSSLAGTRMSAGSKAQYENLAEAMYEKTGGKVEEDEDED